MEIINKRKKAIRSTIIISLIFILGSGLGLTYSSSANNVVETLSQTVCQNLIKGQNATETFVASTCTINASRLRSPFFLTNFTTTLIIPSTLFLTLNSGFGVANYGMLNNTGVLLQKIPFINYGQILNYKTWNVQSTFVQMNDTGASVLTSGFTTNEPTGTITISSGVGFFYNGNRVINNGVISNSGHFCKFISGLSQNGTFSGNAISGNAINC